MSPPVKPAPTAAAKPRSFPYISEEEAEYVIQRSRHIDGEYIRATPEYPAVISVKAGQKIDSGMTRLDEYKRGATLKQHFVEKRGPWQAPKVVEPETDSGVRLIENVKASELGKQEVKSSRPSDRGPV